MEEETEDLGAMYLMHREAAHRQMSDPSIPIYRRIVDAGLAEQQAAAQKTQNPKGEAHAQD